jgi:exopolysaccharide biosynthesis polyprenyl glycosylphosphotransferase
MTIVGGQDNLEPKTEEAAETVVPDSPVVPGDPAQRDRERRRPAAGPRLSWALTDPLVRGARSTHDPVTGPDEAGWRREANTYERHAFGLDVLLCTSGVLVVLIASHETSGREPMWSLAVAIAFLVLIAAFGGYARRSLGDGPDEFRAVLRAGVGALAVAGFASGVLEMHMPRGLVVSTALVVVPTAVAGRYALRQALHSRRSRGEAMSRTLVVGDAGSVHRVITDLRAASYHGYRVVGVCLPSITDEPPQDGVPTLGALADIPQVAYDNHIDVVIVTGSELAGDALRRLSWALGRSGSELVVAPGLVEVLGPRVQLHPTAGLTLLEVQTSSPRSRMWVKAVLDRTLAAGLLAVALPVILVSAVAVVLTSRGAPFYRQQRIGVDGRMFTMWKLRSMYQDADARRAALLAESDRDGLMFKMRQDPRVTRVGRVLRRYSLDELPQLWNVLRGDMSLVGPRPPLPEEVDAYRDAVHRRLRVRPGLTGLWQVSGRADLSWDESIRLDLRYVDNWSVAMDLLILWKTGRAVFGSSGAY